MLIVRFFPAAGVWNFSGQVSRRDQRGHYWSCSAETEISAIFFAFIESSTNLSATNRTVGISIRCVAHEKLVATTVFAVLCFLLVLCHF